MTMMLVCSQAVRGLPFLTSHILFTMVQSIIVNFMPAEQDLQIHFMQIATDAQPGGLRVWTSAIFTKRTKVLFLQCLLYIEKGVFI